MNVEQVHDYWVIVGGFDTTNWITKGSVPAHIKVYMEGFEDRATAEAVAKTVASGELRHQLGFTVDHKTGERVPGDPRAPWRDEKTEHRLLAAIRAEAGIPWMRKGVFR